MPRQVVDVASGGDSDAADLRRQGVGDVIPVQIQRGYHVEVFRMEQNFLKEGVCNAILDNDTVGKFQPGAVPYGEGAVFPPCDIVSPVTEAAFREFHDVALMHQRDAFPSVFHGIVNGGAHQALRAFTGNGLDAEAGAFRETNLFHAVRENAAHGIKKQLGILRAFLEFDSGVDVFRVFAENDHVHFFRSFDGSFNAVEIAHGTQADKQIQILPQRDIQAADASAHRSGEGAFDADEVRAESFHRFIRKPGAQIVKRFLPGKNFIPCDGTPALISLGYGCVNDTGGRRPYFRTGSITDDERNDGPVRNAKPAVLHGDGCTVRGRGEC